MHHQESPSETRAAGGRGTGERPPSDPSLDARRAGYDGTCLRPLGLCELGGSCDACWYRPDHPRHRQPADG